MENEHHDLVNEVLRKIGVNILLFQRIENGLKQILSFVHHPDPTREINLVKNNRERLDPKTLGGLISEFVESADYNVDYFSEHLRKIVNERNRLVHHFSDSDDLGILDTEEGCRACIAGLEAQRREAYDFYEVIQLLGFGVLTFFRERLDKSDPEVELLYRIHLRSF